MRAFCLNDPSDRFISFDSFATGVRALECALSSFTSDAAVYSPIAAIGVPSFPKDRRPFLLNGLPTEEIMIARPCVDLGIANATFETARALVRVFLFCRCVVHPASGAGEFFGRPYALCHAANVGFSNFVGVN